MIRIGCLSFLQEGVECSGIRLRGKLSAMLRRQLDDAGPAFGRFHPASDGTHLRVLKSARHHAVGGNHEILDEFAGAILLSGVDTLHLAVGDHGLGFHAIGSISPTCG